MAQSETTQCGRLGYSDAEKRKGKGEGGLVCVVFREGRALPHSRNKHVARFLPTKPPVSALESQKRARSILVCVTM